MDETVEGKMLLQQKYLINTATTMGSDRIYPGRGTELLAEAIGGTVIDQTAAAHIGNFAALNTLRFCTYEEHPDEYKKDTYVSNYDLKPIEYNNTNRVLSFEAKFTFRDGTVSADVVNISRNE